ncbi:MAG: matrixin family metalloprotease [Bryobacteraceae bacterium]
MKPWFLLVVVLAGASTAPGYTRYTFNGTYMDRNDYAGIQFYINPNVQGGLKNVKGKVVILPGSDPRGAIQAAMNTWGAVSSSAAQFKTMRTTSAPARFGDGANSISFDESSAIQSAGADAIAVTMIAARATGEVVDTDIFFNTDMAFSTELAVGAFDIQQIAVHELGHVLGAGHYGLETGVMYPVSSPEDTSHRTLSGDDIAFVTGTYMALSARNQFGWISGMVRTPNGPIDAAEVIAVSPETGVVVGTNTAVGGFNIGPLPPGKYFLYAQPIDEIARMVDPTLASGGTNFDWQPVFYGSSDTPAQVTVSAGAGALANLTVDLSSAVVRIDYAADGSGMDLLPSGASSVLYLSGKGFNASLQPQDLLLLGPGLSADSVTVSPTTDPNQQAFLSADIQAAARSDWAVAVIGLRSGGRVVPGPAMRIVPPGPRMAPSGVVNAASYGGGTVAPGEILAIFGSGLGSDDTPPATLDSSGRLPSSLGGVTVDFDGTPAPLYYVSSNQVNLQAPFEIFGKEFTTLHLSYQGLRGEAILMPVTPAQPAIFPGAVLNQDGTFNSPVSPAPRHTVLVIYGNGQGVVSPALATGQPAPPIPLSKVANAHAYIGGQEAPVWFAGMAPGFVGLLQMNILIPASAQTGDNLPLHIAIAGQTSSDTWVSIFPQ